MWIEERRGLTAAVVAAAVAVAAYLSVAGGYPSPASPMSLAVVLPGLMLWGPMESWVHGWAEIPVFILAFTGPMAILSFLWIRALGRN